jgi:osmotically-inducible protein OsmY
MGNRQDDRSSRMGMRNDDPRYGGGREGAGREGAGHEGGGREGGGEQQGYRNYRDRHYGREGGYAGDSGYGYEPGRRDEGGFIRESGPGHVPGQRWGGGYGGDRDASDYNARPDREHVGRGFTGNDFGGLPPRRDRAYGAPADLPPRHFGNEVDRGGRMGLGGAETTGRGYWGWDSDRAGGVNVGQMGGREGWNREGYRAGYGFEGTDMGMGARDFEEERGPHYGKGPKGYKRSDERTREDVCDAIAHQGHIDATDVEVKVQDGIVTLSGTVARREEKRGLEHLVERCRGVHEVHNELRLKRETPRTETNEGQTKEAQPARPQEPRDGGQAQGQGAANGNQTKNGKTTRA